MSDADTVPLSRASVLGLLALIVVVATASVWWAQQRQGAVGEVVARLSQTKDLRMISSDTCAVCVRARQWFRAHAVRFTECSIERDATCAAAFEALRAPGTPVFVVGERSMLGFDPNRIRTLLER